ncbi:acyl-CoA thioesterase [Halalkalibacterium ligniniphilum]|uniref:acyl-CoA thioesterase n=1 Tax=Halalkalibacterium ligniniphilum TaxID=1134413 RepID=UPI000379FD97|nr:thioesterase family protein [Halalkalibacterium ligniniphilum]
MRTPSYIDNFESWMRSFHFSIPVKVRFCETDAFGHLNNTVSFIYFEEARIDFFKKLGFMEKWTEDKGEGMIVSADLQCDFLSQIYFDERLSVHVKPDKIGTSSVDLHYLVTNEDGKACLIGRGTMVQVHKKTGKSLPWNEEMRSILVKQQHLGTH